MKKPEQDILTAFLGKTLNMPTEKVATLFKKNGEEDELTAEALSTLLTEDASRVKAFKEENDTYFLNGQKKATKEFGINRDKEIKEKFAITSEKIGLELIEEVLTAKTGAATLDVEKVKVHPEFLKMEKELAAKIAETETTWKSKFDLREQELVEEKTFSNISTKADTLLAELKPILSKDPEKAKNQKQLLINELKGFKYQDNNGELTILKSDGKRLEDIHGKPVGFDSLIKEISSKYWDFETATSRSGTGATNDTDTGKGDNGATKWSGTTPKNDDEFSKEMLKLSGSENADKRIQLLDAYEASQKTV